MQDHKKSNSEIAGRGGVVSSECDTEGRPNASRPRRGSRTGAGTEATKRQVSDRGPLGASNGPGTISDKAQSQNYKTRSRRAILEDTSDEEEDAEAENSSKRPLLKQNQPLPSHDHDQDIDMQLDGVSPERGGSSLRLSVSNDEFIAVPNQAATSRFDNINLVDMTPTSTTHKSPWIAATIDTHSAKRRRNEEGRHKSPSESNKSHNMRPKEAIPSIDIVSHMWLGFPIHEAIATHKGKDIIREYRTKEEFARVGTPHTKSLTSRRSVGHFHEYHKYSTRTNDRIRSPVTIFTLPNFLD